MVTLLQTTMVVLAARSVTASLTDPDVGEGYNFLQDTVGGATEKLIGTLAPNAPAETTTSQQGSTSGGFFAPFGTDGPSEELFERNGSLEKIVPIINVAEEALNQPIPTNDWWGNLIHVTDLKNVSNYAAWSNPYAVKLPREAPYGLQTCYSYTYREIGSEVNGTVKYYNHSYHNDLTLSSEEFFSYEPTYEVYEWDEGGAKLRQVTTNPTWSFVEPEADFEVDFYPARKPSPWIVLETDMLRTLQKDIMGNWSDWDADSWYYNGKYFQKYASLCLMAADSSVVGPDTLLLSYCLEKLEKMIEPVLNNSLSPPLMYDTLYRGIISSSIFKTGSIYTEFGNGMYNDHHYHYGYFITASAMLKHLDPNWSRMPELERIIWTMLRDVVNPSAEDKYFPRFRHFSWYLGHSYSHGVTSIDNGKDEESTSEDINFFYGMTLWGRVTGKKAVEDLGSLMLRLDAHAIRTYFLLKSDNTIHPPEIVRNHVTGIFFDNKVYYNTWFLDRKYAIHGIQMIPVSPINELARTSTFVEQEWNDILSKERIVTMKNSNNTWLSLLLVNAATVNPMDSLHKLKNATMDDGLSRSWALYNAATRCRDDVDVHVTESIKLTVQA
ncbi:DENN domain-containing protein 5B [Phytophthora nicotianae]|uniref:glucan endo-1,3-beta-D-glucosidase n=1 Tax=Phytophthora nicotianae TaxID=4792 RepID=A0A0W8DL13_PHYNI|nr:DENN domain-containing protein 5B [Phytophthora nicotianae]